MIWEEQLNMDSKIKLDLVMKREFLVCLQSEMTFRNRTKCLYQVLIIMEMKKMQKK